MHGSSSRSRDPGAVRPLASTEAAEKVVEPYAPGEKHWHGAAPTTAMSHIAIQERLLGKAVGWMEHVSDEQYHG